MSVKCGSSRVYLLGPVLVCAIALAACSSSSDKATTAEETSAPAEISETATEESAAETTESAAPLTIQFINPLPNQGQWRIIGDCMAEQAKAKGVELTETGSTGQALEGSEMVEQIQQAIATDRGAIITFPASEAFTPVLKEAVDKGIIVGTLYGADDPGDSASYNVGADFGQWGAKVVETLAGRPGDQVVGLVVANETGPGKLWMDGVKAAAAETDNVKIVTEVFTGDESSTALPRVTAMLTANPEINVVATHMSLVTQGIVAAIEGKDAVGDIVLVGNSPSDGGKEALESGVAYTMLLQGLCDAGKQSIDLAVDFYNGKTDVVNLPVPTEMASKDTLEDFLQKGWG